MSEPTYRITDIYAYTEADGEDVGYVELCCEVWEAAAAGAMLYQEVRLVPVEEAAAVPVGGIVLDAAGVEAVRKLVCYSSFMSGRWNDECLCGSGTDAPHAPDCPVARVAALLPPETP